jgi:hypothetical protein
MKILIDSKILENSSSSSMSDMFLIGRRKVYEIIYKISFFVANISETPFCCTFIGMIN